MHLVPYPISVFAFMAVLVAAIFIITIGHKFIQAQAPNPKEEYPRQRLLTTVVAVIGGAIVIGLWAKHVPRASTFLGLVGAGLAVALRNRY